MHSVGLLRVMVLAAFVASALAVAPAAARAEEQHAEKKTDAHGGEAKGGLDFTEFKRYDLGIWTLLVFFLLIVVLSKYAWPHIKEGLEKREATIRNAHEDAKKDRIAAETVLAEARRNLEEAAAKAKTIVDEARQAAEALKTNEREAGIREAEAKKQQAEREIAAERDAMLKDLYLKAVQLATLMSEKALRREISISDQSRLLDESLAELRSASKA